MTEHRCAMQLSARYILKSPELHQLNCIRHRFLFSSVWELPDLHKFLKGSYDDAKKVFGVMQCVYVENTLFSTNCTLLLPIYAQPFWNASMITKLIVLRSKACSDWPAIQCVVIGRIPQACYGNFMPRGGLCNFRDRIYAPTDCNTPKRKENLKSHHMTPLSEFGTNAVHTVHVINNTFYSLFENSLRGIPELRSCITVILPRLFFTTKW